MRILAYSQLLESYRSLTLDSLALSFGVTIDFIDTYVYPSTTAQYLWILTYVNRLLSLALPTSSLLSIL